MKRLLGLAVSAAAFLFVGSSAEATTYFWDVPCDESQVNNSGVGDGSTDSTATGAAGLRYDTVSRLLQYDIAWNGLEGLLSAVHVHGPALPSESVMPHLFNIFTGVDDVIAAGVDRTTDSTSAIDFPINLILASGGEFSADVAIGHMLDQMAYVNIHSDIWPGGEIRCHLVTTAALENQTKGQQKCTGTVNKGYTKTVAAAGKIFSGCSKSIAKGEIGGTIIDCVAADSDGRVLKVVTKASDSIDKLCVGNDKDGTALFPSFGAGTLANVDGDIGSIAPIVTATAFTGALAQVTPDSVDPARSACEVGVGRSIAKCVDTMNKAYDKCAKLGLKGKKRLSFVELDDMGACVAEDAKGKIAKICGAVGGKLGATVSKVCGGVDLASTFASCAAVPADITEAAACAEQSTRCSVCSGRTTVIGLTTDCDLFDDSLANGSCTP